MRRYRSQITYEFNCQELKAWRSPKDELWNLTRHYTAIVKRRSCVINILQVALRRLALRRHDSVIPSSFAERKIALPTWRRKLMTLLSLDDKSKSMKRRKLLPSSLMYKIKDRVTLSLEWDSNVFLMGSLFCNKRTLNEHLKLQERQTVSQHSCRYLSFIRCIDNASKELRRNAMTWRMYPAKPF